MNNLITVAHKGQKVLTTLQLAEVLESNSKKICANFNRCSKKFKKGTHYFELTGEDMKRFRVQNPELNLNPAPKMYLWTESGKSIHAQLLNPKEIVSPNSNYRSIQKESRVALNEKTADTTELIRVESGEVKMDSRMIADHFGKRHDNVIKDIRDELKALEKGGVGNLLIFEEIEYLDGRKRKQPAFTMGEHGALQLAARYDAVARYKLIVRIEELKRKAQPYYKEPPKTPFELISMMAIQGAEQEKQIQKLTIDVQTIKNAVDVETKDWRTGINEGIDQVIQARGGDKNARVRVLAESYEVLEFKARCNLAIRLEKHKDRLRRTGAKANDIRRVSKLAIIESETRLKAIYTGIVRDMVIKYC